MKYNLLSRIIHWLMAVLIIAELALGIYMNEFVSKEAENRFTFYDIHKSIGVLLLALIIFRICYRFIKKPPHLPNSISIIEQKLAKIGHLILYFLMILVPISGYLMSSFAGYPVKFFGLALPSFIETNFDYVKIMSEIHEISAFSLLGMVAIHIIAVLKHLFFDKPENNVLKRMI